MIAIFPEIVACAASGDVERLAVLVRRYFGGTDTCAPRPSIDALLAAAGLGVRRLAMDALGALLARDERGAFTIVAVVSQRAEDGATRFLLAHLLGHYLLDVQPLIAKGDWQVSGYRESVCPLKRYTAGGSEVAGVAELEGRRDARADQFAAALLMPRGMVRRAVEKLGDPEKVAAFFGVPRACLGRRLQEIGLAPEAPVNFLDAERRLSGEAPSGVDVAQNLTAPAESGMPRSYAASTYGATERATRQRRDGAGDRGATAATGAAPTAAAPAAMPPRAAERRASPGPAVKPPAGAELRPPPAPAASTAVPEAGPPAGRMGMERLREIARKLDKGVPAKS